MNEAQARQLLGVPGNADADQVKKAYRQMAFKLHPDRNPGDAKAQEQFLLLSEAYRLLSRQARAGGAESKRRASQAYRGRADRDAKGQGAKAGSGERFSRQADQAKASGPAGGHDFRRATASDQPRTDRQQAKRTAFRTAPPPPPPPPPTGEDKKEIRVTWGQRALVFDLSKGLWSMLKSLFFKVFDERVVLRAQASRLLPGSRMPVSVETGLRPQKKTILVTLPPDFVLGKPVRVKGMGRGIGKMRGDLYIDFLPI